MELLSTAIKEGRLKKKMTQADLAKRLNISVQAVSKWEKGVSRPNADNVLSIIKILELDINGADEVSRKTEKPTSMGSIATVFKIGRGPSSSHTIGPERACLRFKGMYPEADEYKAVLFGSLAKTGIGHGTDRVITVTMSPVKTTVEFDYNTPTDHPNTMDLIAFKKGREQGRVRVKSIGGGNFLFGDEKMPKEPMVYSVTQFSQIAEICKKDRIPLWQYVKQTEDEGLWSYLQNVWEQMKDCIQNGLNDEGILPGGLSVHKKAKQLFESQHIDETNETKENRLICAYAFAIGEQNASAERIVTAPTCGSAGVLPSVLYYQQQKHGFTDEKIIRALATAGIIGNLIRTNASISGAECGCQAEIGSACAMAAAALGELFELSIDKIEYAAEIALEHHLGLTCDPVCGLVQIPCIERNAVAAMRALNSVSLASLLWNTRKISFDSIVHTMNETGRDLLPMYRETSEGGMAKNYR